MNSSQMIENREPFKEQVAFPKVKRSRFLDEQSNVYFTGITHSLYIPHIFSRQFFSPHPGKTGLQ